MYKGMVRRLTWLTAVGLCLQIALFSSAQSAPEEPTRVKELNFVFLHGAPGNVCSVQLLSDSIMAQLAEYILDYEKAHPGTKIRVNMLKRCYPNNVDVHTWATNIADSVDKYFSKRNLILIGHSMGGKAALYAVARNVGGLAEKVALVVTINSPVKTLYQYYFTGGVSISDYWQARWFLPSDQGTIGSVAYYDSSQDGKWVASNKHWLALISGEAAPQSKQFDVGGVDPLPKNMDDVIIPISAQYSDGADVIYYGEHGHNDFANLDSVAGSVAEQILRYIFGGSIECSVFAKGGVFEHRANWLPLTNSWEDIVGEVPASSGQLWHWNESYTKWQEWEDVVGECTPQDERSHYEINRVRSSVLFTSIEELRWLNPDNPEDCRLYLRTKAAPRNYLQVDWNTYGQGLLPPGTKRDRYEVEIVAGTPLAAVEGVSWLTSNPRDLRLLLQSNAEGPFRWFKAEWRTYFKESRERKVIDEIPSFAAMPVITVGNLQ